MKNIPCQYTLVKRYVRNSKERNQIIILKGIGTAVVVKSFSKQRKNFVPVVAFAFE
jgi:hypothetical protein